MEKIIGSIQNLIPSLSKSDVVIILISFLFLIVVIALYVFNDSKLRGGNSYLWLIFTILLGGIIPWIFYLVVRSPYTLEELKDEKERKEALELQKKYYALMIEKEVYKCPVCGEEIRNDYLFCPRCFTQIKKKCPKCNATLEKDAKICPYCGFIFEDRKE
ncbi:MAG: zinc-ribbon domain-containing protein [Candidatus Atribacteria bacterium]|nr:zinc-ribbon domain-containing protein [Candidatus Atribacteria bacterium]